MAGLLILYHRRRRYIMTIEAHSSGVPTATERAEQVSLVDLLDRVLGEGVVVTGRLTLSIAEVDLVDLNLHVLLSSVGAELESLTSGVDARE